MTQRRPLKINWILAGASLAGGVKLNRELADAMVRRGHQVCIAYAAGTPHWRRPWRVRSFTGWLRREVHLFGKQRHHLEGSLARLIPVQRPIVQAQDVPDADVCIASWWKVREAVEQWPAQKGMKVHLIRGYELHGGDTDRVKATYELPGLKVAVSGWLRQIMAEEFGQHDVARVPDGLDPARFETPARRRGEPPTVGMLYGASPIKGAVTAFEALRKVQQQLPKLRVIALGADPIHRDHEPPANFEYHLRPPQSEIPKLYRRADCWVVPSRTEGFGMPGLEAAASRCPVVSTECGGPQEYVHPGVNGHLVPVDDAVQMAQAVQSVLTCDEEEWTRMSQASYDIAQRYNLKDSAAEFERVLYAALDQRDAEHPRDANVA